jgi:osmotically-inducible protein OsmY
VAGVRAVANDIAVRTAAPNAKSDAEIAEAAVRALEWDTLVPDDRVQVIVRGGRVTLQGAVEWGYQKEAAERAVRNLVGVHHVLNSITVNPRGAAAEIQAKIEAAFRRQAAVDAGQVRVDANGGRVTLRGQVRSWSERSAAERAAWAAPGVSDVENLIQVI